MTIYEDIGLERMRQDIKWGVEQHHAPARWLAILAEEFGEVAQEANEAEFRPRADDDFEDLRSELVQVAAVAKAWIEDLDREGLL